MHKLAKVKDWIFPFLLVGLAVFIAFKNYTPGTWLLGWDTLVPELNFKLNITRGLSAVWQEYQGLGLLGGMAHAADIGREIILRGFSYFLPLSFLRYLWTLLMFVIGPLGVYFFTSKALLGKKNEFLENLAGFVSAIFYIFNLSTVQTFFTPFETFVSLYGFFPWFLLLAIRYLKSGDRKDLLTFAIVSLFGTSSFYVQTLFVVFAVFLIMLGLEASFRYKGAGILRTIKLVFVTIFINAFWLAPVAYFTITNSQVVQNSHVNSIATPETKIMNQARSDFSNVARLKGYWFDYYDWNSAGQYRLLYNDWIDYESNPLVERVSLTLFGISAIGLALSLFKPRKIFGQSFIFLFGASFLMLSGLDLSKLPILNDAFRNVFTKWSNAAALTYSVGLGLFIFVISDFIKNKIKYIPAAIFSLIIIGGSVFTTLPILKGKLIADSMKVYIPSYYFDAITYFKNTDPTSRVAVFPLTDFWGWQFNTWGYRGSGFIWYGIPQPILSRTFDVWSSYNEHFYSEINYALNWGDVNDTKRILEKYQVSYILFDNSIVQMGNPNSSSNIGKQKEILESSGFVNKEKEFGEIIIYKTDIPQINTFVSAPKIDYSDPFFKVWSTGETVVTEGFLNEQGYQTAKNCSLQELGVVVKEKIDNGNYYKAENDGVSCDYFYYPSLDYSKAYSMRLVGNNISGRSLRFYLYNVKDEKVITDELLPVGAFDKTFVILPTGSFEDKGGYTLNVETRAFGKVASENEITKIEIYELFFEKAVSRSIVNNLQIESVKKYGTWGYKVGTSGEGLLALGQGYEEGWKAFQIENKKLQFLTHLKMNSWANAWQVENPSTIYIVFWPQALEWGGMVAGLITLLVIILKRSKDC